ncbi:hypothetical protein COL5a_001655 [Colletotrichum fioriniae]|nr:hypothetical protein COL5a_001655 [Colletotrichum fioriniae]
MDFSIVAEGGGNGYAAVTRGSYNLYNPSGEPQGYLDVLFDPATNLPYIIRSYEDHPIFGKSTHDLLVHDYNEVKGFQVPQRFKTIYNGKHLIGDYRADQTIINGDLPSDFFAVPGNGTVPASSVPNRDTQYSFSEIGETSANFLWPGAYTGTKESIAASFAQPLQDLPGFWTISPGGDLGMRQGLIELEDGSVIVLDAPPHQSKLVIEWVQGNLGKNITHVWPTHHHHDHAFGVVDYVAQGAKLIVPEHAAGYYTTVPREQVVSYPRGGSYVLKDSKMQLALVDMEATIHAEDHGYALIISSCPTEKSSSAVFDADHGNLAFIETFDHAAVQELLNCLTRDKVPGNAQ